MEADRDFFFFFWTPKKFQTGTHTSMPTKPLADLCRVILRDVYGELAETVVSTVFDHGRLTAKDISQFSGIPIAAVKRAIVALMQNRFLVYWMDESSKVVYYYDNWTQIYAVLWTGPVLTLVNDTFDDPTAAEVVKNMLVYGHMQVSDYVGATGEVDSEKVLQLITQLVQKRILRPLLDEEFQSKDDLYNSFFKQYKDQLRKSSQSEAAKTTNATESTEKSMRNTFDVRDSPDFGMLKDSNSQASSVMSRKKNNLSLGKVETKKIDKDAIVAVNYEKYLVISRNRFLASVVERRIGKATAHVYRKLLQRYESKVERCSQVLERVSESNVGVGEVYMGLDQSVDIKSAIVTPPSRNKRKNMAPNGSSKRQKIDGSYINMDEEDDDDFDLDAALDNDDNDFDSLEVNGRGDLTQADVRKHLELLADNPMKFLTKINSTEWFVPFEDAMKHARRLTYDEIVTNKCGNIPARLLRIIRDKGRVDEKFLSKVALLQSNDLRGHLAKLQDFGAIDLQEIPRGNDRAPARTYYLWYHDPQRAYLHLLHDTYCTQERLYSRMLFEKKEQSILLSKLEREDVKGNEEAFLSTQEKKELRVLRQKEEKLLAQIWRLDEIVKVFRDY